MAYVGFTRRVSFSQYSTKHFLDNPLSALEMRFRPLSGSPIWIRNQDSVKKGVGISGVGGVSGVSGVSSVLSVILLTPE